MPSYELPEGVERYLYTPGFGHSGDPHGPWLRFSDLDAIRSQERQRVREEVEKQQRFVPGMADEGHPDGSEYPTIRPHDKGDLLRRGDVLAALNSLEDG